MMKPTNWQRLNWGITWLGLIAVGVGLYKCYAPAVLIFAGAVAVVAGCMNRYTGEPPDG